MGLQGGGNRARITALPVSPAQVTPAPFNIVL